MAHYTRLKTTAKERGAAFLYNTNVGAALPWLQAIRQLYEAGERIHRIEATLSGTLSYLFGRYNGTEPFADIVREAHQAGYTEPDPRTDLKGVDATRKLLILCREMDVPLEENEIVKTPFLPESCLQGSIDDFYRTLLIEEEYFKQLYAQAQLQGKKLKYIASFDNGKATLGLQSILDSHPMYHIDPKETILLIYSDNYNPPLAITGAGAGNNVTAMGVLSDIITIAHDYL
jgi:aspartokinase/homoserine dehydrogenase 1